MNLSCQNVFRTVWIHSVYFEFFFCLSSNRTDLSHADIFERLRLSRNWLVSHQIQPPKSYPSRLSKFSFFQNSLHLPHTIQSKNYRVSRGREGEGQREWYVVATTRLPRLYAQSATRISIPSLKTSNPSPSAVTSFTSSGQSPFTHTHHKNSLFLHPYSTAYIYVLNGHGIDKNQDVFLSPVWNPTPQQWFLYCSNEKNNKFTAHFSVWLLRQ